ncbi:hypothetical protein HF086_006649, partial [Spodoptera exigua]
GAIKDDPIRGWLANWYGATGLSVFTAKGLNRVIYGQSSHVVDLIPVDYVANLVIVAGAKTYRCNAIARMVYIEKLLYSCKEIDKIYLLVREKKNESINKRIENLLDNPLFTRLKKTDPESFKKLVPISGDIRLPKLGLKPEDEQTLIDNVFLYISTAFTHTQKKVLVETVYPSPAKVEDIYKFIEEYGDDEQATLKFISWLDNWYGSTPFLMNASEGWLRIIRGNYNSGIDFIPVDFVTNLSIVAAAKAKRTNEVQVFHSTTSADNPTDWSDFKNYFLDEVVRRGKIIRLRDSYEHFSSNAWIMRSDRTRQLHASLSPEDQEKFQCDPTHINWPEYLKDYCRGVLKYLKPRKMY